MKYPAVAISNLKKNYGDTTALKGICLLYTSDAADE